MSRDRVLRALAIIALSTGLGFGLVRLASRLPNFLVPDDGYFYSQIAFSIATTGRSTFDGIHITSGYHLPWAWLLALASRVVALATLDRTVHLGTHLSVAFVVGLYGAMRFFKTPHFRGAALAFGLGAFSLTEMALASVVMLALFETALDSDSRAEKRALVLAFILPLVRVDLVCIPVTLAALAGGRLRPRLGAAAIAGCLFQLLVMKIAFGHFLSVAAEIKTGRAFETVGMRLLYNLRESSFQNLLFLANAFFGGLALSLRRDRQTSAVVFASWTFLALHAALSYLRGWYWLPSTLGSLYALERATRRQRIARVAAVVFGLACVAHALRVEIVYAADKQASANFLEVLNRELPADAVIFTYDNPGFLGFFSGHRTIDGDGLVNDYAYARRLRTSTLGGYLDEERICYLVSEVDARRESIPVINLPGLRVRKDEVDLLAAVRRHHPRQANFILYRLKASRCAAPPQ